MVTGYRFTEDEFIFLAYFYQCTTVPAWFVCEPEQIDPEKALRTLERKGMLLKNGEKDTPHPVVEYLFSQLAQTRAFFRRDRPDLLLFLPTAYAGRRAKRRGGAFASVSDAAGLLCLSAGERV